MSQLLTSQRRLSNNPSAQNPFLVILISMACAFAAPILTVKGHLELLIFGANPSPALAKFDIWLVMISLQAFTWVIITTWMGPHLRSLIASFGNKRVIWRSLLSTFVLLMPLLASAIFEHKAGIPPGAIAGVSILRYFGVLGTVFDTVLVFALFLAYEAAVAEFALDEPPTIKAVRFIEQLSLIQQLFIAASIVLGLGVIGTAAQQSAIQADGLLRVPPEYNIMFGLVGSFVLLAAYAPIRLDLYRKSQLLIDVVSGPAPSTTSDLKTWFETRSSLEKLMGLDIASIFGVGGALPLLLPFIIGSVAKLAAH
jgi:hypothetical protein